MLQCDMAAMERGVKGCEIVVCIITDRRGTGEDADESYLSREMCRQEIRWAEENGKPIVAVVNRDDKQKIGKFIQEGLSYGIDLSKLNFCAFDRTGPRQIEASLEDIMERAETFKQCPVKVVMEGGASSGGAGTGGSGTGPSRAAGPSRLH